MFPHGGGLCLVIVSGGATLITRDPVFVMFKPSLIYGADVITVFGYVWAGLMLVTAGGNLIVPVRFGPAVWATFITMFPLGSKVVLAGVQYGVTRTIVRRRMRASRVAAAVGG